MLVECLAIVVLGAMSTMSTSLPAAAGPPTLMLPSSISSNCTGGDSATALSNWLEKLPANSTVTFPLDGCFVINNTLTLNDTKGLTLNGNGSTFRETAAPTNAHPIVFLTQDSNLTITDLTIDGAYNGSNGGEGVEGDYGIEMEADDNMMIAGATVENIQGDWVYLSPPYDLSDTDALSTGIVFWEDRFVNAGYHGFTVESVGCPTLAPCNGLTIADSTMTNIGVDAMDFEYDQYSTPFNANGTPFWAAQDYVTIEDNTWSNWGNDWFSSVQGQVPGVQEQHLTFNGNDLDSDGPVFEVVGTNPYSTKAAYTNADWTITGNRFQPGDYGEPYHGGTSVAAQLYFIVGLTMTDNTFPLCAWTYETPQPAAACATPDEYVMDLDLITGGTITDNDFAGALGVVLPQAYNTYVTGVSQCGNKYGVNGRQLDAVCTVNVPAPTTTVVPLTNGAALSGSQWLDATASSGVAGIVYELSGNGLSDDVIATGAWSCCGWLAQWNTEEVPDGTYTLQSVASYAGGVSGTSLPVTITVDNLPTTAIVLPGTSATLSGSAFLDATASSRVTGVSYELSGNGLSDRVFTTGATTIYGWLAEWNTKTVPDGTYTLESVASYAGGESGTSPPVTVRIRN